MRGDLAGLKQVLPCQDVLADCRAAVDLVALELCRRTDHVVASVTDGGAQEPLVAGGIVIGSSQ